MYRRKTPREKKLTFLISRLEYYSRFLRLGNLDAAQQISMDFRTSDSSCCAVSLATASFGATMHRRRRSFLVVSNGPRIDQNILREVMRQIRRYPDNLEWQRVGDSAALVATSSWAVQVAFGLYIASSTALCHDPRQASAQHTCLHRGRLAAKHSITTKLTMIPCPLVAALPDSSS